MNGRISRLEGKIYKILFLVNFLYEYFYIHITGHHCDDFAENLPLIQLSEGVPMFSLDSLFH